MAYKKEELIELALKTIKDEKVTEIELLAKMMGISKGTFYNHELHELDVIKDEIRSLIVEQKDVMRSRWFVSDNPTLQIAWYKLHATPEEYYRLSNSDHKITGDLNHKIVIQDGTEHGLP